MLLLKTTGEDQDLEILLNLVGKNNLFMRGKKVMEMGNLFHVGIAQWVFSLDP